MTNVYFVRHAQPDFREHDDRLRPLTEKGLRDCALVCEYLSDKGISRVFSSPFKRAFDTIHCFAEFVGLDITCVEAFRERRVNGGWIEDFDFRPYARSQWADFDYGLPGGECLREVQIRNIGALNELLDAHPGENIAVGTHGTALSTIVNYYDKRFDYERFMEIAGLMPWIVHFAFDGRECASIESIDLFERRA